MVLSLFGLSFLLTFVSSFTFRRRDVSSTNCLTSLVLLGRYAIILLNNKKPRTLLRGTPLLRVIHLEVWSSTVTNIFPFDKKALTELIYLELPFGRVWGRQ